MATSLRVHYFHLIWSTKERKNLILPKMQERLYSYMGGIIRKNSCKLLEIGGIANHVHLLVEFSNLDNYSSVIRNTKAMSTAWLKKEYPESQKFAWPDGYGSFTVSYSQIDSVREYIRNQETHHQTQTFEMEYKKIIRKHNIEIDESHLFG